MTDPNRQFDDPGDPEPDRRHWILHPRGHRRGWIRNATPSGTVVQTPIGEAVVIAGEDPGEAWICDFCNEDIPIGTDGNPFIVPTEGTYAMCPDCFVTYGHPETFPAQFCGCNPCGIRAATITPPGVEIRSTKLKGHTA